MAPSARSSFVNKFASLVGLTIGIAGILFVVRTVVNRWDEVSEAFQKFSTASLVISIAFALGALTIIGSTWAMILRQRGQHVRHTHGLSWYFTGQLGKYVPGGIWAIVGRAEMAVRSGISRSDAYVATAVSMSTTYLASIVLICASSIASWTYPVVGILGTAGLIIGYVIYTLPAFHSRVHALTAKLLPQGLTMIHSSELVRFTVVQIPAWILMSLSTSVTAAAFGADIGILQMFFFTATSWLIGFVAIGVPGGIGVRESVFTALATPVTGAPLAVSIALASRVVFIFADVIGAVVSSMIVRFIRPTAPSQ